MAKRPIPARVRQQQDEAEARRPKVYALRVASATYAEIGQKLGISPSQAHADYHEHLKVQRVLNEQDADQARALELERLDMAARAIAPAVRRGVHAAVREWVRISKRRSEMLGLDAPLNTTVTLKDDDASLVARGRALGLIGEDHPS